MIHVTYIDPRFFGGEGGSFVFFCCFFAVIVKYFLLVLIVNVQTQLKRGFLTTKLSLVNTKKIISSLKSYLLAISLIGHIPVEVSFHALLNNHVFLFLIQFQTNNKNATTIIKISSEVTRTRYQYYILINVIRKKNEIPEHGISFDRLVMNAGALNNVSDPFCRWFSSDNGHLDFAPSLIDVLYRLHIHSLVKFTSSAFAADAFVY